MSDLTHGFCLIDWEKLVRVFAALLTPVIACVTAYIAGQQYKTNKNQFRLALFERRIKVFNFTGDLIAVVLRQGKVANNDLSKFLWETRESGFLFGPDIPAYLDELYEKASDVYTFEGAVDEESKEKRKAALLWFSNQGEQARKRFGTFMTFSE
jgi:hypothetical protein